MMKKTSISIALGLIISLVGANVFAQTILTIDDNTISKQAFEDIYKKNNKETNPSKEDLDEYMGLFINYKLKVMEAEKLRLDTNLVFIKELDGYRNQLAAPYLIDNDKTGALVTEAYERMKIEVKASHILIGFDKKNAPDDTLMAYNKIMDIRKSLDKGGKTFGEMAAMHSTDPSAKSNKGDLGYFKSLQMVYPFECAAYNTKVGEVSQPVRTRFGYHLLKVVDKRPSKGEIRAAHILIMSSPKSPVKDQQVAEERIKEIYKELGAGKSFSSLAIKYSADKSSSKKGGELPQFGSGKMVKEFEDAAFALNTDEEYSEPFKTSYGWHIVQRIELIPVAPKEEMEKELKDRISKDSRANITRQSFLKNLKKEYDFKENMKALDAVYDVVDSNIFSGSWKPGDHGLNKEMFRINGVKNTQADFIDFLKMTQGRADGIDKNALVARKYKTYVDGRIISYERTQLERKYPKFKSLMKEYRDGILLFNLTEEKIWGKAAKDTTGLQNYYNNNMEDFKYDERVKATVLSCRNLELAKGAVKMVKAEKTSKEINDAFNQESKLNVIIESGTFEKNDEEVLEKIPFKVGISDIQEIDDQFVFVNVMEVLKEGIRPYDVSRGLVTAAYQRYLEENWIKELRDQHTIKVNKDVLYTVK
ncbi:MAG: peptidyl-prolyl cis-trans isomerase SurA [Patiriisocius sp.]|jgi:peptidyl-prolyl cis-trans isomerase SurA